MEFIYIVIFFILSLIFSEYVKGKKWKEEQLKNQRRYQDETVKLQVRTKKIITSLFSDLDKYKSELIGISNKIVNDNSEFLTLISFNEIDIKKKGGDEQIFKLLSVGKFLNIFKDRIVDFQISYGNDKEIEGIKKSISESFKVEHSRYGVRWWYDGVLYNLITRDTDFSENIGQKKFLKTFEISHKNKLEYFESLINNFEYLKSLGISMVLFYLSDRTIKYYEIYQVFEQLGTFDRTWEKKLFQKLEDIDDKLQMISESLQSIEYTTSKIIGTTDEIVSELKNINSQLDTSNLLLTINTYQTWRINRNTK